MARSIFPVPETRRRRDVIKCQGMSLDKSIRGTREPVKTAMKANLLHKLFIHEFDERATRKTCSASASTRRQSTDEVKATSRGALYNTCGAVFPAGYA